MWVSRKGKLHLHPKPSYPTKYTTAGDCAYSVTPLSTDICQLRLDFVNFDIVITSASGACVDSFTPTGPSGRNPEVLCGKLTNQHLYVEQARSSTATKLTFKIGTTSTGATWTVKVSQIECTNVNRAPSDCHQYFSGGNSGNVISYGWHGGAIPNQRSWNYCIRREAGYCGISYTQSQLTSPNTFHLDDATTVINGRPSIGTGIFGFLAIPAGTPNR